MFIFVVGLLLVIGGLIGAIFAINGYKAIGIGIERTLAIHNDPSYYTEFKGDRLAYRRQWARMVRREARRRGLL
jgi:hypothetical protein